MNRQQLLLIQLGEELSEVQQSIAKALRFGLDSRYPDEAPSNAQDIVQEFQEAIAVYSMLENTDGFITIPSWKAIEIQEEKISKVNKWLEHSRSQGILKPSVKSVSTKN